MQLRKGVLTVVLLLAAVFFIVDLPQAQANQISQPASLQQSLAKEITSPEQQALQAIGPHNINTTSPSIGALSLLPTRRISIPFGFRDVLLTMDAGNAVVTGGHGGCTEDQIVTVAVTITQSTSSAIATGETQQTCSGELQQWTFTVTTDTTDYFVNAPGEACGFATTRENGTVTDTYEWCKDIELAAVTSQLYLPALQDE